MPGWRLQLNCFASPTPLAALLRQCNLSFVHCRSWLLLSCAPSVLMVLSPAPDENYKEFEDEVQDALGQV